MSGIRGVSYAAPDPWGGCTHLLTDDPYVSSKGMCVGRAPEAAMRTALRLMLVALFEEGRKVTQAPLSSFAAYSDDLAFAQTLHRTGTLTALRSCHAGLAEVLPVLLGTELPAEWVQVLEQFSPTPVRGVAPNLSPSLERTGRACAWIEREDGFVLMTEAQAGWTLPGGGIEPSETPQQAAMREAWEEVGARCEVAGESWTLNDGSDSVCVPLRLLTLESSPEGLSVIWVNPRRMPWADDLQIRQVLAARGQTPEHLQVPPLVTRALALARQAGFGQSCSHETGRLLQTLAASKPSGRLLELGTGAGVGAAWLLSGMDAKSTLLTIENDTERARQAAEVLTDGRVEVRCGDGLEALSAGPFDLIFADCAPVKREGAMLDRLVDALKPSGLLVMDNFSSPMYLPTDLYAGDDLRDALFAHPRLSRQRSAGASA